MGCLLEVKRVVIFGHLPNTQWSWRAGFYSHTHSYIHQGYFRAFKHLGYETHWINGRSRGLENLPVKDTLFFTEGQAEGNLPLSLQAGYVTHSSKSTAYEAMGLRRLQLFNYVADLRSGTSFAFPQAKVEKLDEVTYLDASSLALYQPWATNLLPQEIDTTKPSLFDARRSEINYVGTIGHDNIKSRIRNIQGQARRLGVSFDVLSGLSDEEAARLTRKSLVGMDVRGDWHLERGYIPCRIWKTLSYGKHLTSNSPLLKAVFQDRIKIEENIDNFLESAIEAGANADEELLVDNINWIKNNHTFVNRAKRCLEAFQNLCP
jgi:hypothetical protein